MIENMIENRVFFNGIERSENSIVLVRALIIARLNDT